MKVMKKPMITEVFQYTGNLSDPGWPQDWLTAAFRFGKDKHIFIETLEGEMGGEVGCYIIKGIRGEFYICKKDIFEETYTVLEK